MDRVRIEAAVKEMLLAIGENPEREGLKETPYRVARMCEEIFGGMCEDISKHKKVFNLCGNNDVVVIKDIQIYSMCEHHILPFWGKAIVAYKPSDKVIGLSKIIRIVESLSKKLQLQERLTYEIAHNINELIKPEGIMVLAECEHMCINMRGVKKGGSKTITQVSMGTFKNDYKLREQLEKNL